MCAVQILLILQHTSNKSHIVLITALHMQFYLNITSTYKLIWLPDFLMNLTELLLSVFAALALKKKLLKHIAT